MIQNFVVSFIIVLLLLAEVILPIILILVLGFLTWHLLRKKWIDRTFADLIYKKNPLVKEFYNKIVPSVEKKGNKLVRPVAYVALVLCIALIIRTLWLNALHDNDTSDRLLMDRLPLLFLYVGFIFLAYGILGSVISSFFFIKEAKKIDVYERTLDIYLLGKYLENILCITLGIALIIGVAYLWFYLLEKLLPIFRYFERESSYFVELKVNYEGMLQVLKGLLISFRNQFQTWCIASFMISLASSAIPYLWFKGRRFTIVFLSLFLSGTTFSCLVSFLIERFLTSALTWVFIAVWIFSALITYMVSHLVHTVSINKISICKHCRTENGIQSRYCCGCGKRLISLGIG